MKLLTKIVRIFLGSVVFFFSLLSMTVLPGFTPHFFSTDILWICELILFYYTVHGISIIVWAVQNNNPMHEFWSRN